MLTAVPFDHAERTSREVTVAICDDVREFRELVRLGLEDDPDIQIVGEAADGHEALEVVDRLRPDVLLLDLSMPRRDGLEVIEELRRRSPHTQILVLSGLAASRMERSAISRGAVRYLEKGSPLSDIRIAIHEAGTGPAQSDV